MSGHKTGETVTADFTTQSPSTGAETDADSTPVGTLVINGTDNGATVTVTNKSTGVYKAAVTLPAVAAGDVLQIRVAATVGGVAGKGVVWSSVGIEHRVPSETLADYKATGFSTHSAAQAASAVRSELTTELGRVDVPVSSRAAATAMTTAQADLDILTGADGATLATAQGNYAPSKAGDEMALGTDAITAAALSAAAVAKIEAALLNEGDGQALIDAIVAAIDAADIDTDILPALIRDAILDRVLAGNHDTAGTLGKLVQSITEARLAELDAGNLPAVADAVKADTGAILIDTNELQADDVPSLIAALNDFDPAADTVANVTAVGSVTAKTGYKLASDGIDTIVIETGLNARQAISVIASALSGVLSGAATSTVVIKAAENSGTTRITATTDENGNRSAVVLNLPS